MQSAADTGYDDRMGKAESKCAPNQLGKDRKEITVWTRFHPYFSMEDSRKDTIPEIVKQFKKSKSK